MSSTNLQMSQLFAIAISVFTVDLIVAENYYGGSNSAPIPSTQPVYYPYSSPPPRLEDRNVCDLDASVLLVTDHRRRGEYKAVRVRCSEIANYDEDSCNVCCQNAARRDRNLMNQAMFGFLALTEDDHRYKKQSTRKDSPEDLEDDEDDYQERIRLPRSPQEDSQPTTTTTEAPTTTLVPSTDGSTTTFAPATTTKTPEKKRPKQPRRKSKEHVKGSWKPLPQYKNVKCVCCAPKRPFPVFPLPLYNISPQQSTSAIYG